MAAPTEEVIAVCAPLKQHGGIYCTHMRDEADRVTPSCRPIAPNKLAHVNRLQQRGVQLTLILDSVETARWLVERAARGQRFGVLIEIRPAATGRQRGRVAPL